MSTAKTLMAMYEAMRGEFGHQGWWPGETPLEICIGAILTQNTNWRNVEKAVANLKDAGAMSIAALHAMPHEQLAELIRPAGYFNVKAKRLKHFVAHVHEHYGDDPDALLALSAGALREELLDVNGIGRETADSIVLYAACKPSFVVDAYTFRILFRHGLIGPDDDYESIKSLMEYALPQDVGLWNDYHAQLVAVGKKYCKPRTPKCHACPLAEFPHDPEAGMDGY